MITIRPGQGVINITILYRCSVLCRNHHYQLCLSQMSDQLGIQAVAITILKKLCVTQREDIEYFLPL